jgi:hypothetical protein
LLIFLKSQVDVPPENVTQNLNFLIDAIVEENSESDGEEWEEMCNYLTQKQESKQVSKGNWAEQFFHSFNQMINEVNFQMPVCQSCPIKVSLQKRAIVP